MWEVLPHFVLRTTGFRFELLDELALSAVVAEDLDSVLAREDELLHARERLVASVPRGSAEERLRRVLWRSVKAGRQIPGHVCVDELSDSALEAVHGWNEAVRDVQEAELRARLRIEDELRELRLRLRGIATDARFQEAVWLSSPDMLDRAVLWYLGQPSSAPRSNRVRSVERQLAAYLQRFCAKNDTASFFGPVAYGHFDGAGEREWPSAARAERIARRETFISHWAANALAQRIAAEAELRPHLRLRRHPACRFNHEATEARLPGGRAVSLAGAPAEVVALVDGVRTAADVATALGRETVEILPLLDRLEAARVLVRQAEVPVTELRTLPWLREWLTGFPDLPVRRRWQCHLDEIEALRGAFEQADLEGRRELLRRLEEKVATLTDAPARRRAGQIYADRLVLHEECLGGIGPLRLPEAAQVRLAKALQPVLTTFAAHAIDQMGADHEHARICLGADSDGAPEPLLDALGRLGAAGEPPEPVASARVAAVRRLVRERAAEREVRIDPEQLPPPPVPLDREALIASPDVMFSATDPEAFAAGDGELIVAECHDTFAVWGWALALHPEPDAVRRAGLDLLSRLPASDEVRANLPPSRRTKIVPLGLPGPVIDLRGSVPDSERLAVSELSVVVEHCRPRLLTSDGRRLRLYNGELGTFSHRVLALPRVVRPVIDTGRHTPRVRLGEAILQREQWRLPARELLGARHRGDVFKLVLDAWRARRREGVPRRVYARVPGEPKPVFVDFQNPFLLELLEHLAGEEEVTVTEMLPGRDDLWVRRDGASFCAEMRLSAAWTESQ